MKRLGKREWVSSPSGHETIAPIAQMNKAVFPARSFHADKESWIHVFFLDHDRETEI